MSGGLAAFGAADSLYPFFFWRPATPTTSPSPRKKEGQGMGVRHEFSGRQKRKQGMGEGESPVSEFFFSFSGCKSHNFCPISNIEIVLECSRGLKCSVFYAV